jgi:hypothetical protein
VEGEDIISPNDFHWLTTKPQLNILVTFNLAMVVSNIKAWLYTYVLKLRATSTVKTWLPFVNVIQKFQKAVQMYVSPYIQAGYRTQLSKSVLSCQYWEVGGCFFMQKNTETAVTTS